MSRAHAWAGSQAWNDRKLSARLVDDTAIQLSDMANAVGRALAHKPAWLPEWETKFWRVADLVQEMEGLASRTSHTDDLVRTHLTPEQRNVSAIAAIKAWAQDVGAAIVPYDGAHRQVVLHARPEHQAYWGRQAPALIAGLVREQVRSDSTDRNSVIGEALEKEGVLAWVNERDPADDKLLRVVNVNWLKAHADIYQHVLMRAPGRRCRFCRIAEPDLSTQLKSVEHPRLAVDYVDYRPVLPQGVVTHERCRPYWLKWVAIAQRYPSLEAAQAADKRAHRSAGAPKALPMLDVELPEEGQETRDPVEQARRRKKA